MKSGNFLLPLAALVSLPLLTPAADQKWQIEAESPDVKIQGAVKIMEDASASGGKTLDVPVDGVNAQNVVTVPFPAAATPGRYQLVIRLKADQMADVGRGWRIDIREDQSIGCSVVYGLTFKGKTGYQDFAVPFDWAHANRRPSISMGWTAGEGKPVLKIDSIQVVRRGDLPAVLIQKVWPDRVRYRAKQDGDIAVTLESCSNQPVAGKVRVQLTHDLDAPELLGEQSFSLEPAKTAELKFPFRNPGKFFGYVAQATVAVDGQDIDAQEEFFTVHDNPWAVATGAHDQESPNYDTAWWDAFYRIGTTDPEIEHCALIARKEYNTYSEFFSWAPGECFDLAPAEEIWLRGNGGNIIRSRREIQRSIAALQRHGIACITYIAYQAMGTRALEIMQKKPEWFTYSNTTGDVCEFYKLGELVKYNQFWSKFDWQKYQAEGNPEAPDWKDSPEKWKAYKAFWKKYADDARKLNSIGYFDPNYMLPEVVDFCADQAIASAKMFGWEGLRWDCGHLNPGPLWGGFKPFVDFSGKPQAKSPEELENLTVRNLKRLKERIHAQLPDFAIGSNYGSWEETHLYPRMSTELASNGGLLLDELSSSYATPQSRFHYWDAYYGIMADQGEFVTRLGGHYNPFSFNRGGGKYPVDRLYEGIFRIAGKGHPNNLYFNSRTPFGNFAQFCVRFGRFVFDPTNRRVENPDEVITVNSSSPLWWKKTVGRLVDGKNDYLVVHLINPPAAKEAESDPKSTMPDPITDSSVSARIPAGKRVSGAWTLTAEPWRSGEAPRTQAVPMEYQVTKDKVAVTVPELLWWKVVVLRFE